MKQIYIFGVNGNAQDVAEAICLIRLRDPGFPPLSGFLDDRIAKGSKINGVPVCGMIRSARKLRDAYFVNAIGSPESYLLKPAIISRANISDSKFISIVHPNATISSSARLGRGSVVLSNTSIGSCVKIGNHVMILQNCVISHGTQVENYSVMATGVCLGGNVHIKKGAYLGSQSCIRTGLKIGQHALVGMGSVVLKNVPASEIWCGNPAHYLRPVSFHI